MKIAYVTMQFPVASEAFAAVELRALHRLGAEVSVLAYRGPAPNAAAMLVERGLGNLEVDYGGLAANLRGLISLARRPADSLWLFAAIFRHCWHRPGQLAKALALVPRTFGLLQRLERLRPDVVHLFWGHYPSLLGLLARRRLPDSVISLFLGAYDLEQRLPLSALLARQADLVLTHAEVNLPALATLGVPTGVARVAYRGIEIPTPTPAPEKTRGLMVVAERLVSQKRTADVLRVFAALCGAMPAAQLKVLGDGPEMETLKALARELGIAARVTFAGHVPHDEVLRSLAKAEVALTLSQSRSERLPNIMKEAMLHRCLCLASRSPGIEELIADGETGLLVDGGDIAATAGRLAGALRDPGQVARMGELAQARVLRDFDVDRLMRERLQLWTVARQETQRGTAV